MVVDYHDAVSDQDNVHVHDNNTDHHKDSW